MTALLRREPTGNVVLNSGDCDIRFFTEHGGAPLEFWRHGFPGPVTNSYPGSGCQVSLNTGQDPTQASANGNTKNPICCFGLPHTQGHNYFGRETLFDVAAGEYEVSLFAPDFWLSAEGIDDFQCPLAGGWSAINGALSFSGSPTFPSGIYCPGNEMEPGQLRRYPKGRIAFKVRVNFATPSGIAGLFFRKKVAQAAPTKDEFYSADGYHLNVNQSYGWELRRVAGGVQTVLAGGSSAPTPGGVLFEVRTHNNVPGYMEVLVNGAPVAVVTDSSPILGDAFGCFATCTAGTISFVDRQIFDVGVTMRSRWKSLGSGWFENKVTLETTDAAPRLFYRANPFQCFMNKTLFPPAGRSAQYRAPGGEWQDTQGTVLALPGSRFWTGNPQGTLGLKCEHVSSSVDGAPAAAPHALLAKHAVNDEFIFMFNPLPHELTSLVSKIESVGLWSLTQ